MPKEMKPAYEIIALMEARGMRDREISDATGYNANYIWRIRNETEGYAAALADFKKEIHDRTIDAVANIAEVFNEHVPVMAQELRTIALHGQKEETRLRAVQDWLDRAPKAPKRISRNEQAIEHSIIFSGKQIVNMKAALTDVGSDEVVELLEGSGYEEVAFEAPEEPQVINLDEVG